MCGDAHPAVLRGVGSEPAGGREEAPPGTTQAPPVRAQSRHGAGLPSAGRAHSGRSGSGGRGPASGAGGRSLRGASSGSPSPSLRLCVRRSLPTGTQWARGQGHAGDLAPGDSPGHLRGPVSSPIPRSKVRRPRGHSVGTKVSPDRPQWGSGALLWEESGDPPSPGKGSRQQPWVWAAAAPAGQGGGPCGGPTSAFPAGDKLCGSGNKPAVRGAWRPRHATVAAGRPRTVGSSPEHTARFQVSAASASSCWRSSFLVPRSAFYSPPGQPGGGGEGDTDARETVGRGLLRASCPRTKPVTAFGA